MVAAGDLKFLAFGRAGSSPAGGTKNPSKKGESVSKSSIDYAELSGLTIALKNLEIDSSSDQTVVSWLRKRITYLTNK